MKKSFLIIMLAFCLIFVMTACGKDGGEESSDSDLPSYTIRIADVCAPGSAYDYGTAQFKETVEKATDGRVKVNCYHGDMTTDEIEGIEMVQTGNLEMMWTSLGSLNGFTPITDIMQLPFLFDDPEHLEKCLDSEFGEKILSKISAVDNLEAIAFHEDGWRYVFTTDRKVSKLADMKGLKMRSMMSEMLVDMYEDLGAVPVSISYSELYTSLQTGMVEAQDNGFVPTESDGFTEVLKNVCVSNHFYAGGVVVVADDWLKGLPEEDQKLIKDAAKEAGKVQRAYLLEENQKLVDKYSKEDGWTVTQIEDKDAWVKAVQPVYKKYLKTNPEWQELLDIVDGLRK